MEILPEIEIVDLALYLEGTLIISDVHIGYEEAINRQGVFVPRFQFEDIIKRAEKVYHTLKGKKIDRILINGDLKHEFGIISEQEWRNTLKFIDLLSRKCGEVILIKGNHDAILGPIADKRLLRIEEFFLIKSKNVLVIHGDKIPDKELVNRSSTIIIGHEHPAVSLKDGARTEQFKCFLKGRFRGKNLVVQPSFNTLMPGTDMLRDHTLSPFLKQKSQNLKDFEIFVVDEEVLYFGKLKNLF